MDRTSDISSGDSDAKESAARQLVQSLLLEPDELHRETLADFAAKHQESTGATNATREESSGEGDWTQALFVLVARLRRLEQLESEFGQVLLREKLASMRELAYGASHEINNPLANISSRAQTLLRDEIDPERRRKLATINSQAFRAYEMISDMMLFAKPPDLIRETINVSKLIAQVVEELSGQADQQGTALLVKGIVTDCWLSADPAHLSVAINALCRNSLEAVSAGGQVTISLMCGESNVEVSVTDTGPGIPDAVRRHLFDPFYSGREAGRGLGFGLSKCWRIVELHGGTIEAGGRDGQATCFTIRLPRFAESRTEASPPLVA